MRNLREVWTDGWMLAGNTKIYIWGVVGGGII